MSSCQARRLFLSLFCLFSVHTGTAAALERTVSGTVVDESGRPLARAFVADEAAERRGVFADEFGRFTIAVDDSAAPCRLVISLAGFAEAAASCDAAGTVRVRLRVAPIHETVIVTATRTEAPVGQVGASATVFTEEDLERRQTPLVADLLRSTPGAMLVRSGAPGSLTSLFVRGGESDYNKVLIDGIPVNEPGGAFYLNNLTTENLERIEVVRGAYSALFGSDAMSSVIQLFTKRPAPGATRPRASVQLDGGSYETLHGSAAVTGASGVIDYSLGAALFQSDNRVPNSRLESTTLSAGVGVRLTPNALVRFVVRGELEDTGTPGPTAFGRPDLDARFERNDGAFGVTFDQPRSRTLRQRLSYSAALSHQASTNLVPDPPYVATFGGRAATRPSSDFPGDRHDAFRRHHASYQADWRVAAGGRLGDHLLTVLADWDGERATFDDRLAGSSSRHRRDNFGAAVQHQVLWRRVFLTAGGRVEKNDNFGTALVPRASAVFVLHDASASLGETRLKLSAGSGVKEPTMLESYSTSPYFRGNPGLRPERSRSVEAGVEQRFAADRAKLDVTWFDNRFTDIISLRTDFATFEGQFLNVGVTRARGLEIGGEVAPAAGIRGWGTYTLLDSEIIESTAPENPLFAVGAWAFRRPRHSGSAGATVSVGRTTVDLTGVFIGRFVDSDFGMFSPAFVESPGHTTWDARIAIEFASRLTALVSIDNLTNADYSEPFGYQPLGRLVRAGVRVRF